MRNNRIAKCELCLRLVLKNSVSGEPGDFSERFSALLGSSLFHFAKEVLLRS